MIDCDQRAPNQAKVCKTECYKKKINECVPTKRDICAYSKTMKKCKRFVHDCGLKRNACSNPMIKGITIIK